MINRSPFFDRYQQYLKSKVPEADRGQSSLPYSRVTNSSDQKYGFGHSQQRAITDAIISDLIINCSMPLSIVENVNFRHFLEVVDSRYSPICRSTVSSTLSKLATTSREKIRQQLSSASIGGVSVTVDIWSDRKMRGFLGVTAHTMLVCEGSVSAKSYLLCCKRFKGSHTGEKIAEAFEELCDEYAIKDKLNFIICDGAANMKRAFSVCFPSSVDDDNGDEADMDSAGEQVGLDDDGIWENLEPDAEIELDGCFSRHCKRLTCYAHCLQLVVGDGLKESKAIRSALSKASRLCTLLHTSCLFKEAFEKTFGKEKGIPSDVCTRWHSTLRQVKAVISLDYQSLCSLVISEGHKEAQFTIKEWSQLKELVDILNPFFDAAVLVQGEKMTTIGSVLPSVLSLYHHLVRLSEVRDSGRYLGKLTAELKRSLEKRFMGLFVNVRMLTSQIPVSELPFGDALYIVAAVLNPSFGLYWIDNDVLVDDNSKEQLQVYVKGMVIYF